MLRSYIRASLRFLKEDPWHRLRKIRRLQKHELQMLPEDKYIGISSLC